MNSEQHSTDIVAVEENQTLTRLLCAPPVVSGGNHGTAPNPVRSVSVNRLFSALRLTGFPTIQTSPLPLQPGYPKTPPFVQED